MKLRDLIMLCLLSLSSFGVMAGVGKAADWPCEAVLCLSNLGGPTQYCQIACNRDPSFASKSDPLAVTGVVLST